MEDARRPPERHASSRASPPRAANAPPDGSAPGELSDLAATGIPGLDDILVGGLVRQRLYLIEGLPGSGKTTLALQFLLEGLRRGERVLYVTLSETAEELEDVIRSHGWPTGGITMRELVPAGDSLDPDERYTMFHPSEVELSEATKTILADVERVRPHRVVFDSLSEMRLLAGNALRYRRQILALKQYFNGKRTTVLMLDDRTSSEHDMQLHSLAHGVIYLEQIFPEFGVERRRLRVVKFRGKRFRGGNHDYIIRHGGLEVFPRLVAAEHRAHSERTRMPTGVPELDVLLGGGIERSTSTLFVGAAGTGKSSLAAQFVAANALAGADAAMFIFDESIDTLLTRTDSLGIPLRQAFDRGLATIQPVDPAELAPGQLTASIRAAVEERGVRIVVIDSLNGYLNAMPEERFLTVQLHELLAYLGQRGVATVLVSAHAGLIGGPMNSPVEASYLVDAVILLRYFEARGEIRQAISVVKKRGGAHERTIREFRLDHGIRIGEPLRDFRGVLTGVPVFEGASDTLMPKAPR
jgi:circadian clock protein KaiC